MVEMLSSATSLRSYQSSGDKASGAHIEEPMDLVTLSLEEKVYIKCRYGRELRGKLIVSLTSSLTLLIDNIHTSNSQTTTILTVALTESLTNLLNFRLMMNI